MTISILPYKNNTGAAEFTCSCCGQLVFAPIAPVEAICATCEFVRDMPAQERDEILRHLGYGDQG